MPARARALLACLSLLALLVAGCGQQEEQRQIGDPITDAEAEVLAELLHRNETEGGARYTVTAPYADDTVLTLSGSIDFQQDIGVADAVTATSSAILDERALAFTSSDLWIGSIPGFTEAIQAAGGPAAEWLRRPLTTTTESQASLIDVLVQLLPRLSADSPDDPASFADYTWLGQQSINGELATTFGFGEGRRVAVSAETDELIQYVTYLSGDVEVTITLTDHGEQDVSLPADDVTVLAADYPAVAAEYAF